MRLARLVLALLAALLLVPALAAAQTDAAEDGTAKPGNILLLLADDIGVDRIGVYGNERSGPTPNIDALAARGVRFDVAWATPMCSSTRASLLTGRLPWRTGVGGALSAGPDVAGLDLERGPAPIARVLADRGFETFAVGKWHLAGGVAPDLGPIRRAGFAPYVGWVHNLPGREGYERWNKFDAEGKPRRTETYPTTDAVDDALATLKRVQEPWFGWIGFHAAHGPAHRPPAELHSYTLGEPSKGYAPDHFRAAVEALDTEIGRLLGGLTPEVRARTTVVFVADNGTPSFALEGRRRGRGKHSVHESGVAVPLIVSSPLIPASARGARSRSLVHVTDLYATFAELGGAASTAEDSRSLVPYLTDPARVSDRARLYTERFRWGEGAPEPESWVQAARDDRFKLMVRPKHGRALFDLVSDPRERKDLLAAPLSARAAEARAGLEALIEARGVVAASTAAPVRDSRP